MEKRKRRGGGGEWGCDVAEVALVGMWCWLVHSRTLVTQYLQQTCTIRFEKRQSHNSLRTKHTTATLTMRQVSMTNAATSSHISAFRLPKMQPQRSPGHFSDKTNSKFFGQKIEKFSQRTCSQEPKLRPRGASKSGQLARSRQGGEASPWNFNNTIKLHT